MVCMSILPFIKEHIIKVKRRKSFYFCSSQHFGVQSSTFQQIFSFMKSSSVKKSRLRHYIQLQKSYSLTVSSDFDICCPFIVQEMCKFSSLESITIYSHIFPLQNWRNNHRISLGTYCTNCEKNLGQKSLDHLTSISPYSHWWDHNGILGLQKLCQFRACVQKSPKV